MKDTKGLIEEIIPQMDSPEKVYKLFHGLGYKTLDPSFRGKEAWELREKDKESVREIYTIANYQKRFQIFLVELKYSTPAIIRNLPLYFERETQYPFFVITSDYQNYIFVLVEKIREDVGVWKRKLVKLNLDRESAFYTDKWILSEIAVKDGIEDPVKIYGLLKEAFGVQKVTRKFFTEYKEHFDQLTESLKKNNRGVQQFYYQDKLYAFAQRFLGRLMFLYFLQKKGWLASDKKFISNWFERTEKEGKIFYQSVLEPLFFETLNQKRPNDESRFGKIPFLNGGLFEREYKEIIYIPDTTIEKILDFLNSYNFTISEEVPLEIEVAVNPEMLGRIFESMLPEYERGKKGTFYTPRPIVHYMCRESLKEYLVSFSDIPRYKILPLIEGGKAGHLTPAEAKKLSELLKHVKILDLAVGSGAFLVGMMQEIIRLRRALNTILQETISDAELKREIIQENLYGVDIEPEAIEIARLRLWLSLVVDEDKPEPLPNLDYKILQGNSLIETLKGYNLLKLFESGKLELHEGEKEFVPSNQLELFNKIERLEKEKKEIEKEIKKGAYTLAQGAIKLLKFRHHEINNQLKKLRPKDNVKLVKTEDMFGMQVEISDYHKLRNSFASITDPLKRKEAKERLELYERNIFHSAKEQIVSRFRQEIDNIRQTYRFHSIPKTKQAWINKLEMTSSEIEKVFYQYEKDKVKPFFLPQWEFKDIFFGEKRGFDIVIANPPYVRTQKLSDLAYRDDLKKHHEFIDDLYVHFTFRGFELARSKGIVTFITSDTYLTLAWKERMRRLLQDNLIRRLILTPKAFEATVNTAIYIVQKEMLSDYNLTFIDAREISGYKDENWEDKLIVFEGLKEIEAYDTQFPVRLRDKELEVSYSRYADIGQYRVPVEIYKRSVKKAFFPPTEKNLKLYQKFMPKMNELYEEWWDKIKSSRDIQKNRKEIEKYLPTIRPRDFILLGLITEGGRGLDTGDNGHFLAILDGTQKTTKLKAAINALINKWRKNFPEIYSRHEELVSSGKLLGEVVDIIREEYGDLKISYKPRSSHGIYKIIQESQIADIAKLSEKEKRSGIANEKCWVSFDKIEGEEDIYYSPVLYYMNWSQKNVSWVKKNSGKMTKWGMPSMRNAQYQFREGISFALTTSADCLRARLSHAGLFYGKTPKFISIDDRVSNLYLLGLLNSELMEDFLLTGIPHLVQ